jgi:nucleoside-diphosphate-sugar epimerase
MKSKKILITGGAGFVGHHLALKLNNLGHNVKIIDGLSVNNLISLMSFSGDNLPFPHLSKKIIEERLDLLKKNDINLYIQDLRDYHSTSKIIEEIQPEIVIHLAAVSHADRSNKSPFSTFDHSLRTLENVLDSVKNTAEQFIFLSSSMVYGNFKSEEVNEESKCEPLGIYGALKYSAEKILIAYNQVYNINYTILRPSALYGPRCISRRVGQIFIESAIQGKKIVINGDGSEKLDFTCVEDLIEGINCVIENKQSYNQIFNITYGHSREILSLIDILKKNFKNLEFEINPVKDKLIPKRGTLSIKKAKELINYNSKWALEDGYQSYIDWYKKFFNSNFTN